MRNILHTFLLLLLFSCNKENEEKNKFVELAPFDTVRLESSFDVFLREGSSFSVDIVGNERNVENVTATVENNVLTLENTSNLKFMSFEKNKIDIYITSKALKEVDAEETCNIKTLNPITSNEFGLILKSKANRATLELNCQTFFYWNSIAGGKVTLSGTVEQLKLWNYAIMSVDAKSLTAQYALVENRSEGDCEVFVTERLDYHIDGNGDIHLYGSPPLIEETSPSSLGNLVIH